MADRPTHLPGYPMLPNNFSMNMLAQQQAQLAHQQQQQNPAGAPRSIPGVNDAERTRMWQQIEAQRQRQMGAGDQFASQSNTQVCRRCILLFFFVAVAVVAGSTWPAPDPWRMRSPT